MDQEDLFKSYIDICNRALDQNKDRFPFNCILNGIENAGNVMRIRVKIVDDTGKQQFNLQLKNGKIQCDLTKCQSICQSCHVGCNKFVDSWSVRVSYLQDVIRCPKDYIENPAKLDWEWINTNR